MVVIVLHTGTMPYTAAAPLDGAAAVLTVYEDGAVEIAGDDSLVDVTLPVRCARTRRVVQFWDDAESWARSLPCHAHYNGNDLRARLVADTRVPDAMPAAA